jgi:hypothetical protein
MGWARTLLLGDIGNRLDIEDTERDIAELRDAVLDQHHTDDSQDRRIERLERRVEQLALGITTLSRLLVRNGSLEREDLQGVAAVLERGSSS